MYNVFKNVLKHKACKRCECVAPAAWRGAAGAAAARAAAGGEAVLQGLRAATNYSVSVRARSERGAGPPSPPALCRTRDDGDDHLLTATGSLNEF